MLNRILAGGFGKGQVTSVTLPGSVSNLEQFLTACGKSVRLRRATTGAKAHTESRRLTRPWRAAPPQRYRGLWLFQQSVGTLAMLLTACTS